jgi:hypothetical protein
LIIFAEGEYDDLFIGQAFDSKFHDKPPFL